MKRQESKEEEVLKWKKIDKGGKGLGLEERRKEEVLKR